MPHTSIRRPCLLDLKATAAAPIRSSLGIEQEGPPLAIATTIDPAERGEARIGDLILARLESVISSAVAFIIA